MLSKLFYFAYFSHFSLVVSLYEFLLLTYVRMNSDLTRFPIALLDDDIPSED
jgi:hypothetical protein